MKMVAGWSSGGRGVEGRGERERERIGVGNDDKESQELHCCTK